MTLEQAVESLKQVKSVEEWNSKRDSIRSKVIREQGPNVWVTEYVPTIDGNGLIVEVLGPDKEY
jgi:hypothetical protein